MVVATRAHRIIWPLALRASETPSTGILAIETCDFTGLERVAKDCPCLAGSGLRIKQRSAQEAVSYSMEHGSAEPPSAAIGFPQAPYAFSSLRFRLSPRAAMEGRSTKSPP